ncbi:ribonuclease R [Catenovulum maritimum]|uniref:Ribonuclease R n=1 Tax=Catenovulum maritimum TaxID=1513271 RepID=A0A0J8GZJ4_9ALTE|nr:ribonuclease R [Catenovulum maritimum]KMT66153.1 exoribonuclease R [Catenovulum maritimum]
MNKKSKQIPLEYHPLLADKLIKLIEQTGEAVSYNFLREQLACSSEQQELELQACLNALEQEGKVVHERGLGYATPAQLGFYLGKVAGHRDGFGFVLLEHGTKDLFLPIHQMESVIHGDLVLAKASGKEQRGKREGRIIRVIKPRQEDIVGRYFTEQGVSFVVPDDSRIGQDIMIDKNSTKGARHGQMVVVAITQRPSKRASAVGKIIEVLGEHMAPGMEIEVALRNYDIPHAWPKNLDKELAIWGEEVPDFAKLDRVDLRDLPLVTIDGEDARDFDDAVYCERKKSGGWRLWVAIADVSYYVRPGTIVDDEANKRATSVYFPEQVVPMLPEVLSNGLCSLNPQVDRLCMVCEMTVSERGVLSGYKFYQAVMNSHARLTYTKVSSILKGDEALRQRYQAQVPHLETLHEMYQQLKKSRENRGAIEFETPEPKFVFNSLRKIDTIELVVRNDAHKLIEECMILANVAAARFITKHKAKALYRVHDKPDSEKLAQFIGFLSELGITFTMGDELNPTDFKDLVDKIQGRPDQELIQTMLLRSMKQAIYSGDNVGHFGLALTGYAHFTSPIRRYPDLILHRAIKSILCSQKMMKGDNGEYTYDEKQMNDLGVHTSIAERRADEATRDVANWLKCEYMQDHVGSEFEGVISAVTSFGFFVRINDLHVEGLVHVSSLQSDFYIYDAKRHLLIGEQKRKVYKLGDEIAIKVSAVNLEDKKIDFLLAGQDASPTGKGNKGRKDRKENSRSRDKNSKGKESRREKYGSSKTKAVKYTPSTAKPTANDSRDSTDSEKPKSKSKTQMLMEKENANKKSGKPKGKSSSRKKKAVTTKKHAKRQSNKRK